MNLKEWARERGVSYSAALRWFKSGKLPVPAYQADRLIMIGEPVPIATLTGKRGMKINQAGSPRSRLRGVSQAYRFALDPTPAQEQKLRSHVRDGGKGPPISELVDRSFRPKRTTRFGDVDHPASGLGSVKERLTGRRRRLDEGGH